MSLDETGEPVLVPERAAVEQESPPCSIQHPTSKRATRSGASDTLQHTRLHQTGAVQHQHTIRPLARTVYVPLIWLADEPLCADALAVHICRTMPTAPFTPIVCALLQARDSAQPHGEKWLEE